MPKETFFNLAEAKRKLIEDVAVDEFVVYGYDKASINRIVKNCNIAKGSFYQYFEDKKDLLKHLLTKMAQDKAKYVSPHLLKVKDADFFTILREMYILGLKFSADNPRVAQMANQVLKSKHHPVYQEIVNANMEAVYTYLSNLLKHSIAKGELRPDIDLRFVSYIISAINLATVEYYFDIVKGKEVNMGSFDEDIIDIANMFVDFIKKGIAKPTGGNENDQG